VRQEIIRLKALTPHAGCRAIADSFNRRFAAKRRMTVGKTFASEVTQRHQYEIDIVRRQIKNARPRPVPRNLVWALDLTGKASLDGSTRIVFGILEHASRAALCLEAIERTSSWSLISKLIEAIWRHGRPKAIRTDNEGLHLKGVSTRPVPAWYPPPENRSRLSVAERARRALLRHAEGQTRSAYRGFGTSSE
jgi:hypothetical protein